jgi:hypothetical protein
MMMNSCRVPHCTCNWNAKGIAAVFLLLQHCGERHRFTLSYGYLARRGVTSGRLDTASRPPVTVAGQ